MTDSLLREGHTFTRNDHCVHQTLCVPNADFLGLGCSLDTRGVGHVGFSLVGGGEGSIEPQKLGGGGLGKGLN